MSSEISRIAGWTGRFFVCVKTISPKRRPSTQTPRPAVRSVRLLTPRNATWPRSGSFRLASPPAPSCTTARSDGLCRGGCAAARAAGSHAPARITTSAASASRLITLSTIISPRRSQAGPRRPGKRSELYPELFHAVFAAHAAHPRRKRHAAGQEDADPLLDGDVGEGGLVALAYHDVAQIQMIGRDVHREHRLGAQSAIDRELAGQKSEEVAPLRILDQDDAFEPRLVLGRERDDELSDRRVNRAEQGD